MIVTVTLNPCIDRTCMIRTLKVGGMNRIVTDRRDVSGKGINVSLALSQNGVPVRTCGLLYRGGSELFMTSLRSLGIEYDNIVVDGSIRENIKLWDRDTDVTTEVNQSGAFVSSEAWQAFKAFFLEYVEGADLAVLSGSVPKGLPDTAYRELIELASGKSVPCILDAEGPLLLEGLKAHPLLIKPNEYEFDTAFHPENPELETMIGRAQEVVGEGCCRYICITLGKRGALMVCEAGAWYCRTPDVDIKCTQGAGDSMVAGIAMAYERGLDEGQMLSYGVAMAAGTLSREGTQMCLGQDFERFLPMVKAEKLL